MMALKRLVCKKNPIPVSILFQSHPRMCFSTDSKTNPILKNEENSCAGDLEMKNHVTTEKMRQGIIKATKQYFKLSSEPDESEEKKKKIKFNEMGLQITVPALGFKKEDLTIEVKDEFLFVKGETNNNNNNMLCIDEGVILPSYHTFNPREVTASVVDGQLIVTFPYGDEKLVKAAFTINKSPSVV